MSVAKNNRRESKVEFFNNAYKLHQVVLDMAKNFYGLKVYLKTTQGKLELFRMGTEDRKNFEDICEKYSIDLQFVTPLMLVEHHKEKLLNLSDELLFNIIDANTIYATTESEYYRRRSKQWDAISTCYHMLTILRDFMDFIPQRVNYFMQIAQYVNKEISLLRKWKKNNHSILEKIRRENMFNASQNK